MLNVGGKFAGYKSKAKALTYVEDYVSVSIPKKLFYFVIPTLTYYLRLTFCF